jgi:hypothetical protein
VVAVAIGYIVALVGVLSVFSIPVYASLHIMAVGTGIGILADRTKIPLTRSSWIVLLAGCVLIFCVLALFGEDRTRHWKPFPAGYMPAWFACFLGFRHIRYLILHMERGHDDAV